MPPSMTTPPLLRTLSRSASSPRGTSQQPLPRPHRPKRLCAFPRAYHTAAQSTTLESPSTQRLRHTSQRPILPSSLGHSNNRAASTSTSTPPAPNPPIDSTASLATQAALRMRKSAAPVSEPYVADGATESLFKECASQADYTIPQAFERRGKIPTGEDGMHIGEGTGWWYENLGLTPTFNTWATITMLHMYLLTVRFRYFSPSYSQIYQQHLHDHFFFEAEHRLSIFHNFYSRAVRNRFLKQLYNQWRGAIAAYDEGLVKGDAVLGAAVWRNVFGGVGGGPPPAESKKKNAKNATEEKEAEPDWVKIAIVVSFMRRGLRGLDGAADETIVAAMVRFGNPMSERAVVVRESRGLNVPFGEGDEVAWRAWRRNGVAEEEEEVGAGVGEGEGKR